MGAGGGEQGNGEASQDCLPSPRDESMRLEVWKRPHVKRDIKIPADNEDNV